MGFLNNIKKAISIKKKDDEPKTQEKTPIIEKKTPIIEENTSIFEKSEIYGDCQYLDDLIHSGEENITLDRDIIFDDYEDFPNGIELDVDDIIIEGNGHTIDAQGQITIFDITGKNILIKNIIFKESYDPICNLSQATLTGCTFYQNDGMYGGILNNGEMKLENCSFLKNDGSESAAISNCGKLTVDQCKFIDNKGGRYGIIENKRNIIINDTEFINNSSINSEIINNADEIQINNCIFSENKCENLIYNLRYTKLSDCNISNHQNVTNIINNWEYLEIYGTIFNNNESENIIYNKNNKKTRLSIFNGKFIANSVNSAVYNDGKYCSITGCVFENDSLSPKDNYNINNKSDLILNKISINNDDKTILNEGNILIKNISHEFASKIDNKGGFRFDDDDVPSKKHEFDFTFLHDRIYGSDSTDISLTEDIIFADNEINFYEGGIELDIDNLTIDGNGHYIDGNGKSRIFIITGKNITLKNIVFKNGQSHENPTNPSNNNGGILRINSKSNLTIENCEFEQSSSEAYGGAIENKGNLRMLDCSLKNIISNEGGTIYNCGKMKIRKCSLSNNTNGTVYNHGEMEINESVLSDNVMGAAISNWNDMVANDNTFENNESRRGNDEDIYNEGYLIIKGAKFESFSKSIINSGDLNYSSELLYKIQNRGNIFDITNTSNFTFLNELIHNGANEIKLESNIILDKDKDEDIIFENGIEIDADNIVIDGNNHVIDARMKTRIFNITGNNVILKNLTLKRGFLTGDGAAIYNRNKHIEISDCNILYNNVEKHGGAIYNGGTLQINRCNILSNNAEDGGAIYNEGELMLNNSKLNNNNASKNGGAIFNNSNHVEINGCILTHNEAKENGGAIWVSDKNMVNFKGSNDINNNYPNGMNIL